MKQSRNGKHKEGHVLLGAMVEPEKKAIAIVTAAVMAREGKSLTQTEIIWEGILRLAQSFGVVDSRGKPTVRYRDTIILMTETVANGNRANRGTRGGKRGAK